MPPTAGVLHAFAPRGQRLLSPWVLATQGLSSLWPRGANAWSTPAVGGKPTFSLPRTRPAVGACAQTRGGHRAPGPLRSACHQARVLQTHLGGQGKAGIGVLYLRLLTFTFSWCLQTYWVSLGSIYTSSGTYTLHFSRGPRGLESAFTKSILVSLQK